MNPSPRWVMFRYVLLPLAVLGVCVALFITTATRYPVYVGIGVGLLLVAAAWNAWRLKRKQEERGWRTYRYGRDEFAYEELIDGKWERILLGGDMLVGTPRHVIYLATEQEWSRFPAWARNRRAEIVSRLKLEHPEPEYAYQESGSNFEEPPESDSA